MKPSHDYFYRFPHAQLGVRGRCRVRIYERKNGAHTVVLTELDSNSGESIASACELIATNITAIRGLNPKTTRWIQHIPPHDGSPQAFDELHFTWDGKKASNPQWQGLVDEQAEALTGEILDSLNRRLDDHVLQIEEETEHEST